MRPRRAPPAGVTEVAVLPVSGGSANAVFPPTPQANAPTHWGHGFAPGVSARCGDFGGPFCQLTAAAENRWFSGDPNVGGYSPNGFPVGSHLDPPTYNCDSQVAGWINLCARSRATLQ